MKDLNKIYFPGKEPDEIVDMALRRHGVAIGKKIAEFVLAGLVPIVLYFVMVNFTTWLDNQYGIVYIFMVLFASLFYLFILLFIYHAWVDYYLDIWIITSERIVAIEQKGLFHRVIAELRLNRIQDVSSEVKGMFPTMFKYGEVHVQTASEKEKFWFSEVPHPDVVARRILELHERYSGLDKPQPRLTRDDHQHMTTDTNYFPKNRA